MSTTECAIGNRRLPVTRVNTVVVGSGAAALNTAVQLDRLGCRDLLVVTERLGGGTSNNTGSDKQTYYKLSLAGGGADAPHEMARSLYDGGAMHGDIALVEATLSAQGFHHLVHLGVPFPHDRYGGFVGYKTDHDPRQRATSAGPKTSMLMFQALLAEARRRQIAIREPVEVVAILTDGTGEAKRAIGLVCMDTSRLDEPEHGLFLVNAQNVVYGTGGPAVLYQASVYPECHTGSTGIAFEAGASGQNLTEWQYGLASTKFRWNVSGTYQQVIPRYISTDAGGGDEREFLNPYFPDMTRLAADIFLKGYQWPFDPRKIEGFGSSVIDVLVYHETVVRGRRVFMDFRRNPSEAGNPALAPFSFDVLDGESRRYLEASNALLPTPIERLRRMNPLAIELYREQGIDIETEPLEVAVCAQHHNGGLKGNAWWESDLRHFFPVGEANGSHGVYRPGGSALNSGQCGSLRAAQYIARRYTDPPRPDEAFAQAARSAVEACGARLAGLLQRGGSRAGLEAYRRTLQERMTAHGAHIRDLAGIRRAREEAQRQFAEWEEQGVGSPADLPYALKNRDAILAQIAVLAAMQEHLERGGVSRGSYLVTDPNGPLPCEGLDDRFRYRLAEDPHRERICEAAWTGSRVTLRWVPRRPLPEDDGWFENVWADYREDRIVR